tara:strand:- start:244682 stop:245182 length:501 start_codon:yes stop_codon:yes gene_type:complete
MSAKLVSSLVVAGLMVLGLGTADAKVRKGDRAVDFVSVTDASGKKVSLKKYKKQVVVLTFGASWCKPCGKELPAYEKLAKAYKKKGVVFIAVNIDTKVAKGKAFMKKAGVDTMLDFYDPKSSTVESYDPPSMPSTFVIKKGIVKHVHAGFRGGDVDKLKQVIDKNL